MCGACPLGDAFELLDNQPAADVVAVVRCKDCKYRDAGKGFCEGRGWPMQLVPDDGFATKGKGADRRMSVLVKGIDMPKSCRECHFLSYAYNVPLCSVTRQIPTYPLRETLDQALSKRMNNCPLVEGTEEVRHGRWLSFEFGDERWHKCSICGTADEYINHLGHVAIRRYCPKCGASMDEVEEKINEAITEKR